MTEIKKEIKTELGLRTEILRLVCEYYKLFKKNKENNANYIRYAGRVFDEEEMQNLVDAALDFWLTAGKWTAKFEKEFAEFLGVNYCSLVNSGSSANLIAFMALTAPELGERRILKGDEVITVAAAFPTTVAPIVQYGAVPVFIDVDLKSGNIDITKLDAALSDKTKAVFIAHTLGNPFNIKAVKDFCDKNNLWLIEDNCDALGSEYFFDGEYKYTGTFGDIGTSSFYPPHHITMGEGGAVYTNNFELKRIINSLRDWGRDCWCPSGRDNTCGKRFSQKFGELPLGYDHKYVYSRFGYNLKATDLQAAIGCAQLKKLSDFIEKRRRNWKFLKDFFVNAKLDEFFILPEAELNSRPSWFGFLLTVKEDAPFTRDEIVKHLEDKNIQTRMLFAGNLIKHPCFDEMRRAYVTGGGVYRVVDNLRNTDIIMSRSFWIGVYPGMSEEQLEYMSNVILNFVKNI